jgi:HEAT repeat protein
MGHWDGYRLLGGGKMKRFIIIIMLLLFSLSTQPADLYADEADDSIAAVVDDLFMKASSGEVQFRDLVEPSKKILIEMGETAVPQMITKLPTEDARERHTVEDIFKGIGDPAVPYLLEALITENLYQLRLACSCLGKIGNNSATEMILKLFIHDNHTVRSSAVTAVGNIKDTSAVSEVIDLLKDDAETVRKSSAVALGKIGHEKGLNALIGVLDDPHFSVRYSAAGSLVKIGDISGKVLKDSITNLSGLSLYHAIDVWAELKYKKADKLLTEFLKSDDSRLRGFSIVAMARINPKKAGKYIRKYQKKEVDTFAISCFEKAQEIIAESSKDDGN